MSECITLKSSSSDDDDEVEIVDWRSLGLYKRHDNNFDNVDPSLKRVIKLCLKIELSVGMLRVINRSLLPLYARANKVYIESEEFKEILNRTEKKIIKQPKLKYSYIRLLCGILSQNEKKKRKSFVTTHTTQKSNKMKHVHNMKSTKTPGSFSGSNKFEHEIITIDDDEKENESNGTLTSSKLGPQAMPLEDSDIVPDEENAVDKNSQILSKFSHNAIILPKEPTILSEQQIGSQESLLIAQGIEMNTDDDSKVKIKSIEDEIANLKEKIDKLEKKEVVNDTGRSPYVLCNIYKAQIVNLYNDLCHLTDSPSVKRHEVRLSVMEGHSKEPVKILEKFLNNNIQNNGYPSFPDFSDVKICVMLANDIHKLGWDGTKITKEARALFTQCGRALQKLRQKREWKDLLENMKHEDTDDPAQHDPELMAKLEANKQRAEKKEMDIIEKYAVMEKKSAHKKRKCITTNLLTNNNDSSESDRDSVILCEEDMAKNEEFFKKLREIVKTEKLDDMEINSDVKPELPVKERNSVLDQLEELGDNFTVTIQVDNPFLVVEISSDSDDDGP